MAGVPIKIRPASDKKAKWELVSDSSGEFAQRVPAGRQDYIIEADIKMPKGQPKPQVTAHIEDDERQDVGIHLTKRNFRITDREGKSDEEAIRDRVVRSGGRLCL